MSMHDIEGVVEASVYCIDKSDLPLARKRDLLYNLYKFQAEYDTGYTNFRVKYILMKYHYMFALPIEVHPHYAEKKAEFDRYVTKGRSEWLTNDSFLDKDEDTKKSLFYIDAGCDTWQKLVGQNILTGEQALPVKSMPIFEVVLEIARLCHEQRDDYCAAEWFRTTLFYLLYEAKEEDTPIINSISELLLNKAIFFAAHNDYYFTSWMENYKRDMDEESTSLIAKQWIATYNDWEKAKEQDIDALVRQTAHEFRNGNVEKAFESCKKGLALAPENSYLLLYEAILSIITLQKERRDIESYQLWLEQLQKLVHIENETEENSRIIKTHSLYYIAYVNTVCNNLPEAIKIAEELVSTYKMSVAEELLNYIKNLNQSNN